MVCEHLGRTPFKDNHSFQRVAAYFSPFHVDIWLLLAGSPVLLTRLRCYPVPVSVTNLQPLAIYYRSPRHAVALEPVSP